jgi:hypothetical protein
MASNGIKDRVAIVGMGCFSPRLRELVGYGVYHGRVGHIDKRDPKFLLGDTRNDGGMIVDQYSGKA